MIPLKKICSKALIHQLEELRLFVALFGPHITLEPNSDVNVKNCWCMTWDCRQWCLHSMVQSGLKKKKSFQFKCSFFCTLRFILQHMQKRRKKTTGSELERSLIRCFTPHGIYLNKETNHAFKKKTVTVVIKRQLIQKPCSLEKHFAKNTARIIVD